MEQLYNSTIAAISTAMSNSGIGIVRMSGPEAFQIADRVYKGKKEKKLCDQKSHTIHYGYIVDGEQVIDEVLVMLMRGPHSYTGEDTVEINCHGGVYVVKRILELLIKNGARPAEPGEYTKRAFLNGRLDLSQAEADVIYQNIFRANRDVFQWIGFMLLFLVGYYAVLSKTANYLKNIGDGIDNVLANSKQPIELETELEPIAEKLNTMKMTLARKERMAQESEQRKNAIRGAYHLTGSNNFYDGMITCSTFSGKAVCRMVWAMNRQECEDYLSKALSGIPEDFAGTMLEVPVGTGILTMPVYQTLPKADVTCLDYSPDMMGQAKEKAEKLNLTNVKFQQGDVGALPFADGQFDLVLSLNGFHAFPDKEAAYRETFRVLKPGGTFCGCFYVSGEHKRTDWMIRHVYEPTKFFTPPYETVDSLRKRLQGMYAQVDVGSLKSIAWFICRKAD